MSPSSWLPALLALVGRENPNGDAFARNPIAVFGEHASGFLQMLPSTYAAFATLPGGIWNRVANAAAALRYIRARYGSPFNIPNLFGGPYIGYDSGGWLPPGLSMAWNGTGRPEPVGAGSMYAITVNVPPTANAAAVGGEVVRAIQAYEAGNGKRWRS
jgi:SLT domain-containing protein